MLSKSPIATEPIPECSICASPIPTTLLHVSFLETRPIFASGNLDGPFQRPALLWAWPFSKPQQILDEAEDCKDCPLAQVTPLGD